MEELNEQRLESLSPGTSDVEGCAAAQWSENKPQLGPSPNILPPESFLPETTTSLLTAGRWRRVSGTWRGQEGRGGKAPAHRFAIFSYDFSLDFFYIRKEGFQIISGTQSQRELKACRIQKGLHSQYGL